LRLFFKYIFPLKVHVSRSTVSGGARVAAAPGSKVGSKMNILGGKFIFPAFSNFLKY
jgi:hypothetical protein